MWKVWERGMDCLKVNNPSKEHAQPRPNLNASGKPTKRNRFNALKGRVEKEKSMEVVTCNFLEFSFLDYELLVQGSPCLLFIL